MEGVFTTLSFTDGAGHKLGTLHESDSPGKWVAKEFKRYSSRGSERKSYVPFEVADTTYRVPSEVQHHVAQFQDAAGRGIRTVNPPESDAVNARRTELWTLHLPLQTQLFDEEDSDPDSSRFNTPHIQWKDGLDRLVGVTEVTRLNDDGTRSAGTNHWVTRYAYDLQDNLTHILDSQGNQKWFRYDGLKRKLFMNDPDRGVMEYVYDEGSNLTSTVDAKGQRITYTYDGVNRLLTEDYLDAAGRSPDVRYSYDQGPGLVPVGDGTKAAARNVRGMLAWVQDLSGEEHTSYDARGRVEWVTKRLFDPVFLATTNRPVAQRLVSYRTRFQYDSLDRVVRLTYPDADEVGYEYNARNLVRRIVGGPSGSIISQIGYRASDQLEQIDYGNGVRTRYGYDPRLRLRKLQTVGKSPADPTVPQDLIHFDYEFDGVSNITAIRDQRPGSVVARGDKRRNTQLFQYDDLYRITRATYSFALPGEPDAANGFVSYRYDRIGNMLEQRSDIVQVERGVSVTDLGAMNYGGTAGARDRRGRTAPQPGPHALTSVAVGDRLFPYDANGNMSVIDGMTNTWDFKDRLVQVENAEMRAEYTYDYSDRRVMKSVFWKRESTNNVAKVNPGHVLYPDKFFEVREADAPVKYVWNGNTRVARVTGNLATNARLQRFRLFPGQNLIGLAISTTNTLGQFQESASTSGSILSARRWVQATLGWVDVRVGESLPAGTVLWVEANTNVPVNLLGTYAPPLNMPLAAGPNFIGGWRLEPFRSVDDLVETSAVWQYDPSTGRWANRPKVGLQGSVKVSAVVAPGDAIFARPEVVSTLTLPISVLQVRFYHQDHLGSSSVLTDAEALLVSETVNYAFGLARNEFRPRNFLEPYQFSQKETDQETHYSYFEARHYSLIISRFIAPDPLGSVVSGLGKDRPQLHNQYAYTLNRAVNMVDNSGHAPNQAGAASLNHVEREVVGHRNLQKVADAHKGNENRYFYTEKYGWVDIRHFAKAADLAKGGISPINVERIGTLVEIYQWLTEWGDDYRSGFSPEDRPSNSAGADFGSLLRTALNAEKDERKHGMVWARTFQEWTKKVGARNPEDPKSGKNLLPISDPSVRRKGGTQVAKPEAQPQAAENGQTQGAPFQEGAPDVPALP